MAKKLIRYQESLRLIVPGQPAMVIPVNHPGCTNSGVPCLTSIVERFNPKTGEFETANTIWRLNGGD